MTLPVLGALASVLAAAVTTGPVACFTVRTPRILGLPTARNQNARFGTRLAGGAIQATSPSFAWFSAAAWPWNSTLFGRARASPRWRAASFDLSPRTIGRKSGRITQGFPVPPGAPWRPQR